MSAPAFTANRAESHLIRDCARRAYREDLTRDLLSTQMDLEAVHSNGTPLDFGKLLDFPPFDFAHDICGIARHIDRGTGKLGGCFLPRCAQPALVQS